MQEAIKLEHGDGRLTAYLSGEIDHHSARSVREVIDRELFIKKPHHLVLDFSGVPFMDSSGIGLIIGRANVCRTLDADVGVRGLSSYLVKLVRLSGIEKIDNIFIL